MVVTMLIYDEHRLVVELDRLPRRLRVAFAAACAERLMPAYRRFSEIGGRGDPKALTAILKQLWEDLREVALMEEDELQAILDACMKLVPREDEEPWIQEQAAAEDGAVAVAYSLRCRQSGEAKEAAWAARRVYEALDHFVINRGNIDINNPGAEQRVLSHPLIQAELARQRRDIDELLATSESDELGSIAGLRDRAREDAVTVFVKVH